MRRLTSLIILIIICIGTIIFNGCTPIANPINIVGSTSMQPVVELLAEEFMKENKTITIEVDGGGSAPGSKRFRMGLLRSEAVQEH